MPATYEPIATTTLSSAAADITFSSIGNGYTDLVIAMVNIGGSLAIRFNSDTGTNYSRTELEGDGTSASSERDTNDSRGIIAQTTAPTNPTFTKINIFNYAGSTNKTVLTETAADDNGSGSVFRVVGLWRNTSAITSVTLRTLSGNFSAGTRATLYGILKA